MRTLFAIARADFLERVRRASFLVVLAGTVAAAYGFVPARTAGYTTMSFSQSGGLYNSAWMGTLVSVLDLVVLSLLGFYLVRDAVERDERTGVGQILATTPMTRLQYTLGKFCSHTLVLFCVGAVTLLMAAVMQELRGEVRRLEPWQLALPFLLLVLPGVALVAAVAVLFETFRPLRGVRGSVLYFFLWVSVLGLTTRQLADGRGARPWLDPLGWAEPLSAIQSAVRAHFPDATGSVAVGVHVTDTPVRTFLWGGMDWAGVAPWRLGWALVAVALAALAAVPFHRFNPERLPRSSKEARGGAAPSRPRRWRATRFFERLVGHSRGLTVLWAELALLLRDRRRGWALVAAGLWAGCLLAPTHLLRQALLPLAWLWPLAAWASMGSQEARHRTEALVFVCPRPVRLQLGGAYGAGVLLTALVGSGAALHFAAVGAWRELLAFAVASLFIPALALATGVLSRGPRLFEVTYLLLWYLGPLNRLPALDFLAPKPAASAGFLLATLGLLGLAGAVRARRLRA
ncbi:MAG: hypothetical protein ACLPJH_12045 [Myxococcaceae bacterium]